MSRRVRSCASKGRRGGVHHQFQRLRHRFLHGRRHERVIHVEPAYEYAEGLAYTVTLGEKTKRVRLPKRDQFAPELVYFSDCILRNREPEPSGIEGLQDVQIVEALYRSARTGRAVAIPRIEMDRKPTRKQIIRRPAVRKPKLVNVRSATVD